MLRCLFGKCSSETYVVNKYPKVTKTNGVSTIVPVSSTPPSPTKVTPSNHQDVETISKADPVTLPLEEQQNEQSNIRDEKEVDKSSPVSSHISSQKQESLETPEKEDVKQELPEKENSNINGTDYKENNTSVPLKTRSQAPQPPESKKLVDTVVISESKEQHEPILKETVQSNNENSETDIRVNESSVDNAPVKHSEQYDKNKTEETASAFAPIINSDNEIEVVSTPVINSEKDNKIEKVASTPVLNSEKVKNNKEQQIFSATEISSEQIKNNRNDQITNAPIINSEKYDKIEIVASAAVINSENDKNNRKQVSSEPVINSEQNNNNKKEQVASSPVINSEQNNNNKKEQVATSPVINSEQNENNKKEQVASAPVINSEQNESKKKELVASAPVIYSEQNENNKNEKVASAPVINSEKDKNNKKEKGKVKINVQEHIIEEEKPEDNVSREGSVEPDPEPIRRRSGVVPLPVKYDETKDNALPHYPKDPDDEALIKSAIESNDFLNKIISGKRLEDVVHSMYNREIASKETIIKQGEKGSHMYISAKGKYQVLVKGKAVSEFDDVRVFGELAILYNAKRLASIKALTPGRVWVLDRSTYQQIMIRYNIKEQDEIMLFLMNNKTLNVVGKDVLQEVANLLKPEFFSSGKQIVRQGDKGHKFYIIRAGTVTITKEGEGVVGVYEKGDCFGELALLKEDSRQATVTANAPGVECLTLTRKEFIDYFGEVDDITKLKPRPQNSIKDAVIEHGDIDLADLQIIKTLGVGGFGRVELVQHTKKKELVFALKYLKKIDIVLQHQQDHVYNEKDIQMASKSPFIIRLYRTYRDSKYIYFLMESCLGGDLFSLLQKQKLRRFEEKEARFIAACVLEAFDYLHSRGIVYRDLKPENLLIAANGYIKLTDFGFAKKISSRGRTYTFAGTPEYVAPEIVLNRGHDRAVDYWAFGAFIFELLTGRTPFRTDDNTHMKTYNKILKGIDNIQFPTYVNLKARHIIEKLCRPIPAERLGMQKGGIKDIKAHKWFLGWDWQKFAKCEMPSPFKPKLKSPTDTQYFDKFKKDTDDPPQELSGWDVNF